MLYIGLISGTSMDAVDAALLDLSNPESPRLTATHAQPPAEDLRADLLALSQDVAGITLAKLGELDQRVGHWFADAALALLETSGTPTAAVRGIGSHGQTVHHAPDAPHPFSMQIGDPALIAVRTGIPTVGHLRGGDIAAGGQGAPLVPAFHQWVFRHPAERRAILNIGGIANLTLLPAGRGDEAGAVLGFDTGQAGQHAAAHVAQVGRTLGEQLVMQRLLLLRRAFDFLHPGRFGAEAFVQAHLHLFA